MIDVTAAGDVAAGVEEWLYYLKDALGSVMALVSLDTGAVVERYAYDPYGRTEVLLMFRVEYPGGPMQASGDYYYHDQDFDGDVDGDDAASLAACIGSDTARCEVCPPASSLLGRRRTHFPRPRRRRCGHRHGRHADG